MIGVALRLAANRFPLGQYPFEQSESIQRLDDAKRTATGSEKANKCRSCSRRPWRCNDGNLIGEPFQCRRGNRYVSLRCSRGHPQHVGCINDWPSAIDPSSLIVGKDHATANELDAIAESDRSF